jgi:hypothetical protein
MYKYCVCDAIFPSAFKGSLPAYLKWLITVLILNTKTILYMEEQLRCNICGIMISASQAKQHASTSLHTSLKSKLEHDLNVVSEGSYKNDSSVVILWERSV